MGLFRKKDKHTMDGNIKDPDALAFYYMDTLMCHEYYLNHTDCI